MKPLEAQRVRDIVTPEGLVLQFVVAPLADRVMAFLIDSILIYSLIALFGVLTFLAVWSGTPFPIAVFLVAFFVIRNFYFVYFELRNSGRTPGKKRMGLRVISRDGGPLTGEAILVRNLTRDVETLIPLLVIWFAFRHPPGLAFVLDLAGGGWLVVLGLLPFFNRDRLRCGDMLGGTITVRAPDAVLLSDISQTPVQDFSFTDKELNRYGVQELQVLEDLLRDLHPDPAVLSEVARRICRKIGRSPAEIGKDSEVFLHAFYRAQRAYLERRLLFGERRETKDQTAKKNQGHE